VYGFFRWAPWGDGAFHLQGDRQIQSDSQKRPIEDQLFQFHGATILPGKVDWNYSESALLPLFTGNRSFISCYYAEERFGHFGGHARAKIANDFYDDKLPDPLAFLRANDIAAVVIWPSDAIPDATLASLRQKLAPDYNYVDCRKDGSQNAGIFLGPVRPLKP